MTTERLSPVSLGSCPTCTGPAQFMIPEGTVHAPSCSFFDSVAGALAGLCNCSTSDVRHVALPNIDADLGDGWKLYELIANGSRPASHRWQATGLRDDESRSYEDLSAFGDTPSQAYLALRSAIEARR